MLEEIQKNICEVKRANKYADVDIRPTDRIHITQKQQMSGQVYQNQEIGWKPKGLWYSIGWEWIHWVEAEMPEWAYPHVFRIDIHENRILRLSTADAVRNFHEEYKVLVSTFKDMPENQNNYNIDWRAVSKNYAGIEINPYQYSLRYDYLWYYGWDVASGCIWRSQEAIENITKLK